MKPVIIIAGIIIIASIIVIGSIFFNVQTSEDENVLYENGKLTIDDFKVVKTEPNSFFAKINAGFQKKPNIQIKIVNDDPCEYQITSYEIKAHFTPSLSQIDMEKAKKVGIPIILNHEQRHFDIYQIYAKIINVEINAKFANQNYPCSNVDENSLESANLQNAIDMTYPTEILFRVYADMSQEHYEKETFDSADNQIVWDKKIDLCLSYDSRDELQVCQKLNEFKFE